MTQQMTQQMTRKQTVAILGAQWGDEGKGKVSDLLAASCDAIVRFQGGPNAGHTIVTADTNISLHQLPSGMLHPHCHNFIGPGCVLSLQAVHDELEQLAGVGIDRSELLSRLTIDASCTLILPSHRAIDALKEQALGDKAIGTTKRGIGPAYQDRAARTALLLGDLQCPDTALMRLQVLFEEHRRFLSQNDALLEQEKDSLCAETVLQSLLQQYTELVPSIEDVGAALRERKAAGDSIILEGAQGALLDLYSGGWPWVTSSPTRAGAVAVGAGVPYDFLDTALGVAKAYQTRVGSGPFPTEMDGSEAEHLRNLGGEFGATTGRERRCGWLDLPALKSAVDRDGIKALALTKLDILDSFEKIKVAVNYDSKYGGSIASDEKFDVEYKEFDGWMTPSTGIDKVSELPSALREYLAFIEEYVQVPIVFASFGPMRDQHLWIDSDWRDDLILKY